MKSFAIVGAGAVGSYYGGRLAEAGYDVRFLLRSDYEPVKRDGLRVESSDGDFDLSEVRCARTSQEIGKVDVVIVAWKTTANDGFEAVISPMLHEHSVILTLQNGLGNVERLSDVFGAERVLGALCFVCINRIQPGLIRHTGGGAIAMGEAVPGMTNRLQELAEIFTKAKIVCQAVEDLIASQWRKLVWNVPFNGLCITEGGIDTEALLAKPGCEDQVRAVMAEVILAAKALGYEIEEEFINVQIERTRPMGKYRPSSMIDYVEGREIEIEAIWGEPLRRAEGAGVSVPQMAALYQEIKTLSERR